MQNDCICPERVVTVAPFVKSFPLKLGRKDVFVGVKTLRLGDTRSLQEGTSPLAFFKDDISC